MIHACIATILLFGTSLFASAQSAPVKQSEFQSETLRISKKIDALRESNNELQRTVSAQEKQIEDISEQLAESRANIKKLTDSTKATISDISTENQNTHNRIETLDQTISKRTLYWTILTLALSLMCLISFVLIRTRLLSNSRDFDSRISATKSALERLEIGANKHDADLAQVLQRQLGLSKAERTSHSGSAIVDHKLPIKVGDEIHRMRKRIEHMPQDVKGLGALRNSLTRLEEEFNENGYEIGDLIGKKYIDGMKMEARFVENPEIPLGEEIITDVLRPQIYYKGEVIQVGKVEVGKSY